MAYFVTGATGFIGRHLVQELLDNREGEIFVLVREGSREKLDDLIERWGSGDRVVGVTGDLTKPKLGVDDKWIEEHTGSIDHFFHLAASYDMTADDEANETSNVDGTRHAVQLANALQAGRLHHTSSVAAAGDFKGLFREDHFDEGQKLPSAYHRTKFESERIAREESEIPWRVYRPAVVVGNSKTGEMDKVDGPYYFFKAIQKARATLPPWFPLVGPELGHTNIVPVDFVAAAMDHIAHEEGLDGQAFHLCSPKGIRSGEVLNIFARAAHAPQFALRIDKRLTDALPKGVLSMAMQMPQTKGLRRAILADFGIPDEIIGHVALRPEFDTRDTERVLKGTGIEVPPLESYSEKLWDYWERELDPDLYKDRSFEGAVNGRTVVITGASSGIGKAAAMKIAMAGGVPLLVARTMEKLEAVKQEIEEAGGTAYCYSADLSDLDAIDEVAKTMLDDHPKIDMLVNNAGRSIRRGVQASYDRFHDLRAHDAAQLLRDDPADDAPAAAHEGARLRPHRERLVDRRADQPAALQRLRGLQGRARRVDARGQLRGHRRRDHVHDDPHAAGQDADDRADQDVRLVPDDHARRGRRPRLRGDPRAPQDDQHEARDVRRGALHAGAEGRRPDPAHGLQGLPGVGRLAGQERPQREGLHGADGDGQPHEGRALVAVRSRDSPSAISAGVCVVNDRRSVLVSGAPQKNG